MNEMFNALMHNLFAVVAAGHDLITIVVTIVFMRHDVYCV